MEVSVVVEEAQQKRSDVRSGPVLVPPEPRHHAVGSALVLDLEHRPLAWLAGRIEALGDHAVQPRALEPLEPVGCLRPVGRRRREVDRRAHARQRCLEQGAPLRLGHLAQVAVSKGQQIPRHERGRRLRGQHPHA